MRLFPLLLTFAFTNSFKILVYNSKLGHSNTNFFGNIADILVEAGHDVTSLLPEVDPSWSDGTKLSKKIHVPQADELKSQHAVLKNVGFDWFGYNELDPIEPFFYGNPHADRYATQCRRTLAEPGLIDRLKDERFDVMITENFDMCGTGLSHLIKPKALINGAASIPMGWMVDEFGLPKAWSHNPSPMISHLDVHSFWSRLKNIYADIIFYRIFYTSRSLVDAFFKEKYGADFPTLMEISSHAAYTLINSEPLVDFATPTLSRIVYVGGLGAKEPKPLEKKFENVLNLLLQAILISFGSIVESHSLKRREKDSIVTTALNFPNVTFIWKYEKPEDDFAKEAVKRAANLHLFKWIPQNDLLADKRVAAFITHAGGGSTQEIMMRGKPGLFVPNFGDQPRNAGMMQRSGLGKVFDKRDVGDSVKLTSAVAELLDNDSYAMNAERIAAMIAKKPFTPKEYLIKTVEFAAEFGPSPALRPQSFDMSWVAYHNLDIIVVIGAIFLILSKMVLFLLGRIIVQIFTMLSHLILARKNGNQEYAPVQN